MRALAMDRASSPLDASADPVKAAAALARFLLLHVTPDLLHADPAFADLLVALEGPGPLPANIVSQLKEAPPGGAPEDAPAKVSSEPARKASASSDALAPATTTVDSSASTSDASTVAAPSPAPAPAAEAPAPAHATLLSSTNSSAAVLSASRAAADRDTLSHFLTSLALGKHVPVLVAMGVASVEGLKDLSDQDLTAGLGLSNTQVRLLRGAVDRWAAALSAMIAGSVPSTPVAPSAGGGGSDAGNESFSLLSGAGAARAPGSPLLRRAGSLGEAAPAPLSPMLARATSNMVTDAMASSVRDAFRIAAAHPEASGDAGSALLPAAAAAAAVASAAAVYSSASGGESSSSPTAASTGVGGGSSGYDWEEYATQEGYLYYASNASPGLTQWMRPFEGSVRTLAVRAAEQAAIAAMVEEKVRAALVAQRAATAVRRLADEERARNGGGGSVGSRPRRSPSPSRRGTGGSPFKRTAPAGSVAGSEDVRTIAAKQATARFQSGAPPGSPSVQGPGSGGVMIVSPSAAEAAAKRRPAATGSSGSGSSVIVHARAPPSPGTVKAAWSQVLSSAPSFYPSAAAALSGSGGGSGDTGGLRSPLSFLAGQQSALLGSPTAAGPAAAGHGRGLRADDLSVDYTDAAAAAEAAAGHGVYDGAHSLRAASRSSARAARERSPRASGSAYRGGDSVYGGSVASGAGPRLKSLTAHASGGSVLGPRSVGGMTLTSEIYPEVFDSLPMMDPATADTIVRGNSVATTKRMGYADPRPDVRPQPMMGYRQDEQGALALHFSGVGGPQKKADAAWMSGLRGHLYAASADPKAARAGEDFKRNWAGSNLAPSEVVPSYAYRHAAATSMVDGVGSVYDRLTDIRGFTGTHRHRFGADGRGLGLAGRDNSLDYAHLVSQVTTDTDKGYPVLTDPRDMGPTPGPGKV